MFVGKKIEVQLFGGTITHAEGSLGLPFLRRGHVNDLKHSYDTVNLGLTKKI